MRIAIFSDVHGNLEALDEFAGWLDKHKIDRSFMLGDVIGYGADPLACHEKAKALANVSIKGNHEAALYSDEVLNEFTDWAREALVWTRDKVPPEVKDALSGLQLVYIEDKFTFVHGSLARPEAFDYIMGIHDAWPTFRHLSTPICFIGHTHVPYISMESEQRGAYISAGRYPLKRNERYIINVGSVGQPRDRDPRLAFATFDTESYELELVRLVYDNKKSAEKIIKAGLPHYLAERLL
ncbi:MAG: metallophosphoesterase family protein [Candidatus Omnitrophica bacterium]|nr:metallophosphoesterase family protein [Candidatus Omnitrophota bacterium]